MIYFGKKQILSHVERICIYSFRHQMNTSYWINTKTCGFEVYLLCPVTSLHELRTVQPKILSCVIDGPSLVHVNILGGLALHLFLTSFIYLHVISIDVLFFILFKSGNISTLLCTGLQCNQLS